MKATVQAKNLEPIHPGEILLEEFMKPMGISINLLSRDIGVPANRVSAIVNGKRSISADTALRLAKYFSVSPQIWVNLQALYDLRTAQRTTWPRDEQRVHVYSSLPKRELSLALTVGEKSEGYFKKRKPKNDGEM
jgi:addiction module HigA family antidote